MDQLLSRLAERIGQAPFTADAAGRYHVCIDGHSVIIERQGADLVVTSPFNYSLPADSYRARGLMIDLLKQVTSWARSCPQGIAINELGNLVLQARLAFDSLELNELEQSLCAQAGILETLGPWLLQASSDVVFARPTTWRP